MTIPRLLQFRRSRGSRQGHIRNLFTTAIAATPLLALAPASAQTVIHVPSEQPSIQAAINAAANGATIQVAPGTYRENINFSGKAITVASDAGPATTIIDGGQAAPVVLFKTNEGNDSVLNGFTIQNGKGTFAYGYEGGGILVQLASPTIKNNVITNNLGGCDGLGIAIRSGSPIIDGNTITQNTKADCGPVRGGGIAVFAGTPTITNNSITANAGSEGVAIYYNGGGGKVIGNYISGNSGGAAISSVNAGNPDVIQNVIVGNTSWDGSMVQDSVSNGGAGMYLLNNTIVDNPYTTITSPAAVVVFTGFDSQTRIYNNVIVARAGQAGISCDTLYGYTPQYFSHNDVYTPQGTAFVGGCAGQAGQNGNISADPKYLAAGNYHPVAGSPLLDAGDIAATSLPSQDFEGYGRAADGNQDGSSVVDIGAYEYQGTTTMASTPGSLTFSDIKVGQATGAQDVTLSNTGSKPLLVAAQVGADFQYTSDCMPHSVAPGSACRIHVVFAPASAGAHAESLVVKSNAGADVTIGLQGTGLVPAVTLTPAALNLGSLAVGTTSAAQTVTIQNSGQADLVVMSVAVAGDFAQSNNCGTVHPGQSCTANVTFTPTLRGSRTGTLQIIDDAAGSPQTVALTGTGLAPDLTFSPSSLNFGSLPVGAPSAPQTVTITSSGDFDLSITSFVTTLDYTQTNNCPATIPPGGQCTMQVTFQPSGIGTRVGNVTLATNAVPASRKLSLTGVGLGPQLTITSRPTLFPDTVVGGTSPAQPMFVRNTGNTALLFTSITASGDFTQTNTCGTQLDPGVTCVVAVTFAPVAAGTRTGTVSMAQNSTVSPIVVSFSGNALAAYPAPTLTNASPRGFAVKAAGTKTLTLFGTNFFSQSVVLWNGSPMTTKLLSGSQLSVTLSDEQVADTGEAMVQVQNPAPGGGVSSPVRIEIYRPVSVSARSMVWDALRRVLYATVSSGSPTNANYIVSIDPASGAVRPVVFAGSDPNELAISDDSQFLYVGVDGNGSVARVNLNNNTVDETISLPADPLFGSNVRAIDLAVLPGQPHSVAVSMGMSGSPSYVGAKIYDDTTPRKNAAPGFSGTGLIVDSLLFIPGVNQMFGSNQEDSAYALSWFDVDANGLTYVNNQWSLGGGRLYTDGKLIYETNPPRAIDPATKTVLGKFTFAQNYVTTMAVDGSVGRVFLGATGSGVTDIYAGDMKTYGLIDSLEVPVSAFWAGDLIHCGGNCMALRLYNGSTNLGGYSASDQVVVLNTSITGAPQTGWWWDPKLSGIGIFIEQGGKSDAGIFAGGFWYDTDGKASWQVSTGPMSSMTYNNNWLKLSGGQTLTGSYHAPSMTTSGSTKIAFSDPTHAVLTRPDGTIINLERFSFSPSSVPAAPVAGAPQSGWWWAGSSLSGTGYGIEIQGSSVFIVAYVYDDAGNPVWYLATGGLTSPTSYSGTWDLYAGGPQLTSPEGTYSSTKVAGKSVAMSLTFSDATHGTLTMGSVTIPIVRFQEF